MPVGPGSRSLDFRPSEFAVGLWTFVVAGRGVLPSAPPFGVPSWLGRGGVSTLGGESPGCPLPGVLTMIRPG